LAQQFGRTLQAIVTKRSLLGIPRFISQGEPRPWTEDEDALPGATPEERIVLDSEQRVCMKTKKPSKWLRDVRVRTRHSDESGC